MILAQFSYSVDSFGRIRNICAIPSIACAIPSIACAIPSIACAIPSIVCLMNRVIGSALFAVLQLPLSASTVTNPAFTLWSATSVAPNSNLSNPSFPAYMDNLVAGSSSSGFTSAGTFGTPTYFTPDDTNGFAYPLEAGFVTDDTGPNVGDADPGNPYRFNSWMGQADPGSVFGAAFAGEHGSHLRAPLLLVTGNGGITVDSIQYANWSVTQNGGGTNYSGNTLTTWTTSRIGVSSFGVDGVLGGGDDSYLTSGLMATIPVVAVIYAGPGSAMQGSRQYDGTSWTALDPDPTHAEVFGLYQDQFNAALPDGWDRRVDYTINYNNGSTQALTGNTVYLGGVVPEPSVLGLVALTGLGLLRRRR